MTKIDLLPEESLFIRGKILDFLSEATPERRCEIPYVAEHQALPLYLSWVETLGIRPDGTLVRWSTEGEYSGVRELDEEPWTNVVLLRAARFPELARLVPTIPAHARTCPACQGTGKFPGLPDDSSVMCQCGGTGWTLHDPT